jgi:hypothetical protein
LPLTTAWKSARFHVGQSLNPYTFHDTTSFASSTIPYPHPLRLTLQFAFPEKKLPGRNTGLPRSAHIPLGERRCCLFAGGATSAYGELAAP